MSINLAYDVLHIVYMYVYRRVYIYIYIYIYIYMYNYVKLSDQPRFPKLRFIAPQGKKLGEAWLCR